MGELRPCDNANRLVKFMLFFKRYNVLRFIFTNLEEVFGSVRFNAVKIGIMRVMKD